MNDKSDAATPTKTELYGYLLDILAEYQLPGGKLDGHSLITDLATAKRFREGAYVLRSDYDAQSAQVSRLRSALVDVRERSKSYGAGDDGWILTIQSWIDEALREP